MLYRVFGHWEKSYLNTRKNTIFLRVKISFVLKRIATDVLLFFTEFCLYNKQKNTWVLGNTRFISRVEHDISLVRCAHSLDIMFNTRNKFSISVHPCIILYLYFIAEHYFTLPRTNSCNSWWHLESCKVQFSRSRRQ